MKNKYAQVIINLASKNIYKPYTYLVPENMEISPGMSVLVPFGKREITGYVVSVTSQISEDFPSSQEDLFGEGKKTCALRALSRVFSSEIWMNEDLLSLARWMAQYYISSLDSVLKCILPGGLTRKKSLVARIRENSENFMGNIRSKDLASVFQFIISSGGSATSEEICKSLKIPSNNMRKMLKSLENLGLLELEESFFPPAARPKIIQVVKPAIEGEELECLIESFKKSAPAKALVLQFLRDTSSEYRMSDLSRKTGVSAGVIRALKEKKYIILKDVEVRRNPLVSPYSSFKDDFPFTLTPEQEKAYHAIAASIENKKEEVFLLHGITGSGKTEVYLQAIARALSLGRQVIMLVPEISLTPQTIERFYNRFGNKIAVLHSRLSQGERYDEWRRLRDGEALIAIGTRSALFAPVPHLGLIIIDEEHETSYKQDHSPRYHVREVALQRAKLSSATVIMGSATPSFESFYLARRGDYRLFSLPFRVEERELPSVEIVNMCEQLKEGNRTIFSYPLQRAIWECLDKNEKVILFLNRRGYSSFVLCRDCGYVIRCKYCAVSLKYHSDKQGLSCHYCDYQCALPRQCPSCRGKRIKYFGVGTQKVELEVKKFFPSANTVRMDTDTTTRKGSHRELLEKFLREDRTILIGTQMIAKGLDIPEVTLVGIITADTAINLPDFRAGERTFQLLTQVAGRAGRGDVPGKVILQTYAPDHPGISAARNHDFLSFYEKEIEERRDLSYPPFGHIIRVLFTGRDETSVRRSAEYLSGGLRSITSPHMALVLGPCEAPLSRIKENYRWHLIFKGEDLDYLRKKLVNSMDRGINYSSVKIVMDVDPVSMI